MILLEPAAGVVHNVPFSNPNSIKHHSEFVSCLGESNGEDEVLYSIPLDPINSKSPLKQIQNLMRILFRVIKTCGGFGSKNDGKITDWKAIKRADHFLIFEDLFVHWLSDLSFNEFGKSSGERLAFLINLHNLLSIYILVKKEGKRPARCPITKNRYNISGCQLNTNELESGIRGLYTFNHKVASPCNNLFVKMGWPKECLIRDVRVFFALSKCNEQSSPIEIMGVEDLSEKLEACRFHYLNQIQFDEKKKKIILPLIMQEYYHEMKRKNGDDIDVRFLINKDLRSSNIKMNTMITGDFKLEYKFPSYYSVSASLRLELIDNSSNESNPS